MAAGALAFGLAFFCGTGSSAGSSSSSTYSSAAAAFLAGLRFGGGQASTSSSIGGGAVPSWTRRTPPHSGHLIRLPSKLLSTFRTLPHLHVTRMQTLQGVSPGRGHGDV